MYSHSQASAVIDRPTIDCPQPRQWRAVFAVKIPAGVIKARRSGSHSGQPPRHRTASTQPFSQNQKRVCFVLTRAHLATMTHCTLRLHYALACRSLETAWAVRRASSRSQRKRLLFPTGLVMSLETENVQTSGIYTVAAWDEVNILLKNWLFRSNCDTLANISLTFIVLQAASYVSVGR